MAEYVCEICGNEIPKGEEQRLEDGDTILCSDCKSNSTERTLTIKMRGRLKEINSYCSPVGELANKYDLAVEFL